MSSVATVPTSTNFARPIATCCVNWHVMKSLQKAGQDLIFAKTAREGLHGVDEVSTQILLPPKVILFF
jgi:hypothetical protein